MTQSWNTEDLIAQDLAHMLHPVTNLHAHKSNGPLVMVQGQGVRVTDSSGKSYIDGFAGLWNVNVGHGRARLAEAGKAQLERLAFQPTFFGLATPPAIELAAKLATMLPQQHFQFTSGGAESNETAIKMARYYWSVQGHGTRTKIITRKMAYHGIAMGALAATGIPAYWNDFGPVAPGFVYLTAPYDYRNNPGLNEQDFVAMLAKELEDLIVAEGADTIAAMIAEPVQGAGGVVVPPETYWAAIAPVLKKHNILLIADEVITGFGRTGFMFAQHTYGFEADIVTFAKGITSGYVPLGGVGVSAAIYDVLSAQNRMFMHGFTYAGHPVACAVALENIAILEEEQLPKNAAARGDELLTGLQTLLAHPNVGNVRGKGLMALLEVVEDKDSKKSFDASGGIGAKLQAATRKRGLIARCNDTGIAIAPPLVINAQEIGEILGVLHDSLKDVLG